MDEILRKITGVFFIVAALVPGGIWYSAAKASFEAGDFQKAIAAGLLFIGFQLLFLGGTVVIFVGATLSRVRKEIRDLHESEP